MRILYNTSDDAAVSTAEVIAADEVLSMHELFQIEGNKDIPGIVFTLKAIESLPEKECYYDTVYWFRVNEKISCASMIRKLYQEDKLDLTAYEGITLWNASLETLRKQLDNL